TGIAQDLPYKVYFIHDVIGDNEALAVTSASGITSMADLVDKKIGVPFGSTTHFSLLSALDNEGIDPTTVQILDLQPQDMLAAWQRGDIDGGFVWQPTLSKMLDEDGTVLITAKQLAEEGIITADLGVVSTDFEEQYPDFLKGYVEALDEAVQLYRDDPEAASVAMAEEIGLTPEESLAVMNELVWLSAQEQSGEQYLGTPEAPGAMAQVLKDSAEFMVKQEAITSAPDIDTYQKALFSQAVTK
ncbi:MAG: ABC transporter substrate-binding protein, partial [Phormidesmis sp.]